MKPTMLVFAALALMAAGVSVAGVTGGPVNPDVATVVKGGNEFAFDLYAKLKDQPGNLFFSPYSISTALAMTYAGARGRTAEQMATTLHFTLAQEKLHAAFADLINRLNAAGKEGSFQLVVSNALWGQKGYKFLDGFLKLIKESYGGGLQEVDFEGAAEAARKTINDWVAGQTQGKIRDLIPPDALTTLTRLVLTNAIYFKGAWVEQFQKAATKEEPFTVTQDRVVNKPMMHLTKQFGYAEDETTQVLQMRYVGGRILMVVLLPKKVNGLAELEKTLTAQRLEKLLAAMKDKEVNVTFPRFKTTSEFELAEVLPKMGMVDAFGGGEGADFSGMTGNRELSISNVIHKAFVDVNEEGTEAAAATAVILGRGAAPPQEIIPFRADHPFLFLIRDDTSGSVLFVGRVVNP